MGLTVVTGDVVATRVGRAAGSEGIAMGRTGVIVPGGANTQDPQPAVKEFFDHFQGTTGGAALAGHTASIGRGDTDDDITYITLHNDSGVECFIYPNAAGNGVIVQTTRP